MDALVKKRLQSTVGTTVSVCEVCVYISEIFFI